MGSTALMHVIESMRNLQAAADGVIALGAASAEAGDYKLG